MTSQYGGGNRVRVGELAVAAEEDSLFWRMRVLKSKDEN